MATQTTPAITTQSDKRALWTTAILLAFAGLAYVAYQAYERSSLVSTPNVSAETPVSAATPAAPAPTDTTAVPASTNP